MDLITCISCNVSITADAVFCYKCGNRVKCSSCDAPIFKDAKFCYICGTNILDKSNNKFNDKNTVKYRRTKDEVFCEVSLTDEVGKEGISGLINNLTNNNNVSYKRLNILNGTTIPNIDKDEQQYHEVEDITNSTDIEAETILKEEVYPHLKDVEININCSEGDWILIYAFYESNYGKKTCSKKAVYNKYMSKRKTASRVKNFSKVWNRLFKHYFATVSDTEIKFKLNKLDYVKEVIIGKQKSKTKTVSHKKKTNNGIEKEVNNLSKGKSQKKSLKAIPSYSIVTELNLNPNGKTNLKDYFAKYKPEQNPETFLVIVHYLEKEISEPNISENKIYTCYKHLTLPVPNIRQTLQNIHSRKGWINTSNFSDLKVTVAGENYIEHEMKKKS